MSHNGKQSLLEELEEITIRFQEMDDKLMKALQDWRRTKEIPDEEIQATIDELVSNYSKNQDK